MPQLTKIFPGCHDTMKVVNRLDKYVSGGVVVGREDEFVRMANKTQGDEHGKKLITKRYVGVLAVPTSYGDVENWIQTLGNDHFHLDTGFRGSITRDLAILNRDYGPNNTKKRYLKTVDATTNIRILPQLKRRAPKQLVSKYPLLYESKLLLPMILETVTGRKNQLRDHILETFGLALLNDDNFALFKLHSASKSGTSAKPINSAIFKSNQIGLHAGYVKVGTGKGMEIPLSEPDRELWSPFLQNNGYFISEISHELKRPIFQSHQNQHLR